MSFFIASAIPFDIGIMNTPVFCTTVHPLLSRLSDVNFTLLLSVHFVEIVHYLGGWPFCSFSSMCLAFS